MRTISPFEIVQMLLDNIFVLVILLLRTEKSVVFPPEKLTFKIKATILKLSKRFLA